MKNINTKLILAFSIALSAGSYAAPQISGKVVHESAKFTSDGNLIGNTSTGATIPNNKDVFKTETAIKVYVDGEINELIDGSTYHIELQGYNNGKAITNYDGNESDTQRETLREAYIDTTINDWAVRTGKQQVVWGKADGIKLLDAINPTDYSELVQNQMDDSRLPLWMINAETYDDNGALHQVVLSEGEINKIPGMNSTGDSGHAFIMKGVDTITGKRNGFLNVAPALAKVASSFNDAAAGALFDFTDTLGTTPGADGTGDASAYGLAIFTGSQVGAFAGATQQRNADGSIRADGTTGASSISGATVLYGITEGPGDFGLSATNANGGVTNLVNTTYDSANPDAAFEYMPTASFATFNTFDGATSSYLKDDSNTDGTFGYRYNNTTDSGINYSIVAMRRTDSNPYIDLSWRDSSTGEELTVQRSTMTANGNPNTSTDLARTDLPSSVVFSGATATNSVAILLKNSSGEYYGAYDPTLTAGSHTTNGVDLRFTEKTNMVSSLGMSMDTSIETESLGPVVLRTEAMYTKDEMMPIVDRKLLAIGDLSNALSMKKSDTFKYVLGADVTALTNMMVSAQFIQMINLDYVDTPETCTDGASTSYNCGIYTADMATMHLTNDLQKGREAKEFYSLYLSKPYGESGQHRWNNIFMFEEGGGKWNRLDTEFTLDDNTVLTAEYNKYFGDENTQFGQFKNSSNVQLGLKYSF